ncbi:hypothetical protein [Lysobacter sp. Root604]|uniref:hypothetical protein n=1 Tax=Lysobacter sp. Root604 TaxID=1736568 RepID=UPI0006F5CB3E|nr:hypothetical protein [Lysobacter sp. Root604]KRA17350.1 hypothetical protein ASD69_11655 [Lysobacter sp. Root604]
MSHDNPYQPPTVSVHDALAVDAKARLYSLRSIGLATFLGSVFAGGLLMALNYRALGRPSQMRMALIGAFVGTVALIALSMVLPEEVPAIAFLCVQLAIVLSLAHLLQGPTIRAHEAQGATMHSNWRAAGIALLVLLGLVAVMVVLALLLPDSLPG